MPPSLQPPLSQRILFSFLCFSREGLEVEIGKDQASLATKCPTENALRAGMPDCESGSLRNRRATQPEMGQN